MYEDGKAKKIGRTKTEDGKVEDVSKPTPYNWKILSVAELIRFRDEITATLPPTSLADMNLEEEMLLQYHSLRAVQNEVLHDPDVPVNQQAQISNSVSQVLTKLAEKQQEIYTSERLKRIESILIEAVQSLPTEVSEAFLTKYEEMLELL